MGAQISEAVMRSSPSTSMDVVILEFSQHGRWFLKALHESPELEPFRQPALTSGANVFVKPDEAYHEVVNYLQEHYPNLQSRHVVVLMVHEEVVRDVVARAASTTPKRER